MAVTAAASRKGHLLRDIGKSRYLLLLALPVFLYAIFFRFLPMYGVVISFFDYNPFTGLLHSKFIGLKNFVTFFRSYDLWRVLSNTFFLGVYRLIGTFPAPIILALVINEVRNPFFKRFVQTASYLPYFVSVTVVAGMTVMFLNPTTGLVNTWISMFGGEPIYFMSKPELFKSIYVLTDIWQGAGWSSIIYLAAIASVDPQLYESAMLDGANKLRQIIHITLPGIAPTIVIMLILSAGSVASIGFEKVYLLQNAMIMASSDVISTYVYRMGIVRLDYSFATAVGLFNSVIGLFFVWGSNYLSRRFGEHNLF
jgi:putative aldouronate transport system permease protein